MKMIRAENRRGLQERMSRVFNGWAFYMILVKVVMRKHEILDQTQFEEPSFGKAQLPYVPECKRFSTFKRSSGAKK